MVIIPAIDLKDAQVVRLIQGDYNKVSVYSKDPEETARVWQSQGAGRLHIVDLDGAKTGTPKNLEVLRRIIEGVDIPVQFGGGLRKREDVAQVLDFGIQKAVLGTRACQDLVFIEEMVSEFGEKIIVSIDVKEQKVAIRGWAEVTDMHDVDLIKRLQSVGVNSFIYTDISRDGMLSGPHLQNIERVLNQTGAALIYSGGISSIDDVQKLKTLDAKGLLGVIIGKALYEKKIDLALASSIAEG